MFQKSNEIFTQFKEDISKSIKEEDKLNEVIDVTERYIERCTLFDTLFSLSRTTYGSLTNAIIDKLQIVIKKLCYVEEICVFHPKCQKYMVLKIIYLTKL